MKKIKLFLITGIYSLAMLISTKSNAVDVTFRVDMQYQTVPPEGVHIAGNFQGWDPGLTAMTLTTGAIYTYTYTAAEGQYIEYKFINGDAWGEDESVPAQCSTGGNRFLTVPSNDIILEAVCFASCYPCILPLIDITLQVDMSNETVSPQGVFVQGSFQNPAWSGQQMTHIGNDVYSITVQMGVGSFQEYKFLNGTTYETVPPACGWGGYSNRYLTVPAQNTTLPLVCFGSCDPCVIVTFVDVTFRVDMSETTVSSDGVHIAGGFQGWNPGGTLMTDIGNGIWSYTTTLQSGSYHEYKFINGNEWGEDEQVPWYCANNSNRYLYVPENNVILTAVCYGSCLICNPHPVNITFQVDMSMQQVSPLGIHLAGTFQGWVPGDTPMTHIGNNIYEATVVLGEGEFHEYKFINGIDWPGAENVPGDCAGLGGNREFFVPGGSSTLDLVCFSECNPCIIPTHHFDLNANLEGPFNGISMNTILDDVNVIPINQPYNSAPWNYYGTENLSSGPASGIVDWILIEFRSTDGDASTATADKTFHRCAGILMNDGSITRTDGVSPIEYTGPIFNNLYIVIWHRNHLPVMSASALSPADGDYEYDFTDALGKAYLDGQKSLGNGEFGMIAGDSDANGIINNLDKTQWDNSAGERGYLKSDSDLDAQSDNVDKNDIWDENLNSSSSVPQ